MNKTFAGIFLIAFTTLMIELVLIRVFDVILYPNMAYMVVTCTLFAFGLSGIYVTLRPPTFASEGEFHTFLCKCSVVFALLVIVILPITNFLPLNYFELNDRPITIASSYLALYLVLTGPFFVAGLMIAVIFSRHPARIQRLYFFDLVGAALGCVILIPFLPLVGPGGVLLLAGALGLLTAGLFSPQRPLSLVLIILAVGLVVPPIWTAPNYIDFDPKINKRGFLKSYDEGKIEFTRWDPIAKIDVIDETRNEGKVRVKHVAYDGGSQSSLIYPFEGNYAYVREHLREQLLDHFWHRGVPVSHFLKRDTEQEVLIIGSAAGQETLAALMYNAGHVDAVEMVETVVDIGIEDYADLNGGIFNDSRVSVVADEGRSFLRRSEKKYDIIQIHSNHTSSSVAAGSGAMATVYLQTAEAYKEYFDHLADDGVLHINHHFFPRMITTAALAWKDLGREDFQRHVVVFNQDVARDNLPTMLIKMSPWTEKEMTELKAWFSDDFNDQTTYILQVDPLDPTASFLPPELFSGELADDVIERAPYRIYPATDDRPYFKFLRKSLTPLTEDQSNHTDRSTAAKLNSQLIGGVIPMDIIHLVVTSVVSLFFAVLFIVVPLRFSSVGKQEWPRKGFFLLYFSCLGFGFIVIELVLIQLFMRFIGSPLYSYSTVLFGMLLAAGIGSAASSKLSISLERRWQMPFLCIVVTGILFLLSYDWLFHMFLGFALPVRILVALAVIFPLGFFLGMPFPLGILASEERPLGAVAWGWGLNGLFTVIGGLLSVVLSIFVGFQATLVIALLVYVVAFGAFYMIRKARDSVVVGARSTVGV